MKDAFDKFLEDAYRKDPQILPMIRSYSGPPLTVTKAVAYIPYSIEMMFDETPWADLPMWARKEWFKRGYGLGAEALHCDWPRPTWRTRAEMKRDSHERRLEDRIHDQERDW